MQTDIITLAHVLSPYTIDRIQDVDQDELTSDQDWILAHLDAPAQHAGHAHEGHGQTTHSVTADVYVVAGRVVVIVGGDQTIDDAYLAPDGTPPERALLDEQVTWESPDPVPGLDDEEDYDR